MRSIENIEELIKNALKEGKKDELRVLRLAKAKFMEVETAKPDKKGNKPALDKLKELKKMVEERKKVLEDYKKAKRADLIQEIETEIQIIKEFLPEEIDDSVVEKETEEVIKSLGRKPEMKDMKEIMAKVKEKYPGAKSAIISTIVKKYAQ